MNLAGCLQNRNHISEGYELYTNTIIFYLPVSSIPSGIWILVPSQLLSESSHIWSFEQKFSSGIQEDTQEDLLLEEKRNIIVACGVHQGTMTQRDHKCTSCENHAPVKNVVNKGFGQTGTSCARNVIVDDTTAKIYQV